MHQRHVKQKKSVLKETIRRTHKHMLMLTLMCSVAREQRTDCTYGENMEIPYNTFTLLRIYGQAQL